MIYRRNSNVFQAYVADRHVSLSRETSASGLCGQESVPLGTFEGWVIFYAKCEGHIQSSLGVPGYMKLAMIVAVLGGLEVSE